MLPDFAAGGHRDLIDAMPKMPMLQRDIWLVVHSDVKNAPTIRAVTAELRRALNE